VTARTYLVSGLNQQQATRFEGVGSGKDGNNFFDHAKRMSQGYLKW